MAGPSDPLLNSLVGRYLAETFPGIGKKFNKEVKVSLGCYPAGPSLSPAQDHTAPGVTISLAEVLSHFSQTAPPARRAGLGAAGGPATVATGDTEDSEEDSSSGAAGCC
jgi:hypothetical protein